jgi:predicted NBD/HSP70 family sugar kinase
MARIQNSTDTAFGGTNLGQGHIYNRRLALEAIRVHGTLSRADLTRLTGLAPQTISNICASLVEAELVTSKRRNGAFRGQPPVDLTLNPDGGYAFGISIDADRLFVALVDLVGTRLADIQLELVKTDPASVLPRIFEAITTLRKQIPVAKRKILGTGIAMTGLTTHGSFIGLAPDEVTASWQDFPLDKKLGSLLKMPIFTDNDARAAAVGEALYGQGRNFRDFVYIYFGVGIGGGVISSSQPFRGSKGRAGEFGHMVVASNGRVCTCGNRGCLEQYASMGSALRAISAPASHIHAEKVLTVAFENRDERHLNWIDEAAAHLRIAISNLENIFDPEAVLLGGIIPRPILNAIYDKIMPLPRTVSSRQHGDTERLVRSSFGPAIPAMGAASLALFEATSADPSLLFKKNGQPKTLDQSVT